MKIKSDTIIPIEQNFRVSAGPGAGKTYWLVNHIKNVLANSYRLMKSRKVACITYTNIGVETINKRLGNASEHVEVSTIHSFLYNNIVKPYIYLILPDYGVCVSKIDGHDEMQIKWDKVKEWLDNLENAEELESLAKWPRAKGLRKWLETIRFKLDSNNKLILDGDNSKALFEYDKGKKSYKIEKEKLEILKSSLISYKKLYWQDGIIDHDDVLFFSYQLIFKYPFILEILRAKYPYFFVDEFQDSNPIQVAILKKIADKETIVGIIGDPNQAIYSFQGADVEQFNKFKIDKLKGYEITGNRRSTNLIIDVLNSITGDFQQDKIRNVEGEKPIILVGDNMNTVVNKAKEICKGEDLYVLSRKNITSNAIRNEIEKMNFNKDILDEFKEKDKDKKSKRQYKIINVINAIENAKEKNFKEALRILNKIDMFKDDKIATLRFLNNILTIYEEYYKLSLKNFYEILKNDYSFEFTSLKSGSNVEKFYIEHMYSEVAINVKQSENRSKSRTIHQSKGDEYDNVLIIKEDGNLDFLLKPNLKKNEEHRIYYVAMSRAKKRLFIYVPSIDEERKDKLKKLFDIICINKYS